MKVRITDKEIDRDLKTDVLTIDQFNDIAFHPYLQSINWEAVIIDISPRLTRSYVSQIFKKNFIMVPVIDKYPISNREVLVLMEMLPERAAELMKNQREGNLETYMKQLSDLYKWDSII